MAYKPTDWSGAIIGPNTAYPYGAGLDGSTYVNFKMLNDTLMLMQKMMDVAGVVPSSTPDNVTNGYQLYEALQALINPSFSATGIVYGSTGGYTAANLGAPYYNVGFKIDGNMVELCGAVAVSIPAPGTFTLFTLPAAARPASQVVVDPKYSISNVSSLFTISTAGVLSYSASGSTSGNIYLDGLRFRLL
jgi:hypothetical protein